MLYEFCDLNNWIFEKQKHTSLQQKLYWFCAIRAVFLDAYAAVRDQLRAEILDFNFPPSLYIPYSDYLEKFSYYIALDAILSWVDPKFNMQCIIAHHKNSNELPRGIVLYNKEFDQNGEPYIFIYYLIAMDKGQKVGLGLLRSVLLEFPPDTQFYLEVHKVNHPAMHVYEKLGFSIENTPKITTDFNLECSYLMGVKSSSELLQSIPLVTPQIKLPQRQAY